MLKISQIEPELVWQEVCNELKNQMSGTTFKTWIEPHKLIRIEEVGGDLRGNEQSEKLVGTITAPSGFHALKFESAYGNKVKEILKQTFQREVEINFQVQLKGKGNRQEAEFNKQSLANSKQSGEYKSQGSRVSEQRGEGGKKKTKGPEIDSLFSEQVIEAASVDQAAALARSYGLRDDFTFDTFAVSSSNEMAHAAAVAVSNKPGINYNPLFLYGGVGVGKTHLMHAIANNIIKQNPSFKVLYCTGEEFTNEIIRAIQNKRTLGFKDKYRSCQVLLIDDIQFIAGKNAVQEEFFHTFNALVKRFSQIVLTSDRPPQEINLLEDRLRSRFEAGLVVDIQQPSFELRTAILLIKLSAAGIELPIDLAQIVAAQVDSARKIEGVIKRLMSEVELKGRVIDRALIEEVLSEEIREQKLLLRLNPADVLATVANHFHLKQSVIRGKKRVKEVVLARHIAMFLFKTELGMSYVEIGKWFGSRDHTSAMHAIKKINDLMNKDEELNREIGAIRMSLAGVKN